MSDSGESVTLVWSGEPRMSFSPESDMRGVDLGIGMSDSGESDIRGMGPGAPEDAARLARLPESRGMGEALAGGRPGRERPR